MQRQLEEKDVSWNHVAEQNGGEDLAAAAKVADNDENWLHNREISQLHVSIDIICIIKLDLVYLAGVYNKSVPKPL